MGNGNGVSRGDRNRNARLDRLRALVPVSKAIVGIDLADRQQMVVVCDHDSKVFARKTYRCRAWDLGAALDWAAAGPRRSPKGGAFRASPGAWYTASTSSWTAELMPERPNAPTPSLMARRLRPGPPRRGTRA
jgi:hypothetical protein